MLHSRNTITIATFNLPNYTLRVFQIETFTSIKKYGLTINNNNFFETKKYQFLAEALEDFANLVTDNEIDKFDFSITEEETK